MDTLERKFLETYGDTMSEHEYWWFVEQHLIECFEREARKK
jgi:hypothetical protein